VQDLKVKEIAQILDKSSGAVRVSLHRAIKQLKNILKGKDL
jgi:DNA-directed RNA polymerase specialized sigma24 family protein